MARGLSRGEIWFYRFDKPDKRRPVVIISRQEVIPLIRTVTVAPITTAIRGAPSEVIVGTDEGLKKPSAINLDHVQTVSQSKLERYVGSLSQAKLHELCKRLAIAVGCA